MKKTICFLVGFLFLIHALFSQDLSGVRIYINPGHGGYDSDDRNVVIYPFTSGDPNGFWESQSNLDKGLQLKTMLDNANATTFISRTTNTTADDLALTTIVRLANESDADFMLSIHSNAGGAANHVLMLYAGVDPNDTQTYPTPTPWSDRGREISTVIADNLFSNEANTWGNPISVRGDKTFARTAMGWSDGYGVLRGLTVPGCISEGSMHDYIPETYRLMNMEYKWLEAWHFYKSFCQYFDAGGIPTGNIVGTVHDSRNKNLASYVKIAGTKDELLPLHGAKVTIKPGNLEYITDDLYNGIYVFKNLLPGTYEVITEAEGYVSDTSQVSVESNETAYYNVMLNKKRNTPPQVISFSPNVPIDEPVECSSPIIFNFNWDIDTSSAIEAFSIVPEIAGKISFEDSQHRMIFKPDVPYDTTQIYSVTLDKKLKHHGDLYMEQDFSFQFLTKNRNRLEIIASYPKPGDEGVYYQSPTFEFWFDAKIATATVRDAIKIFDATGNELTKNTRSVLNNKVQEPYGSNSFKLSNNLVPGETYTIRLSRDLIDVNDIDIVEPIEYTFKATDVKVTDKTVAEPFETAGILSYQAEESQKVTSASFARNTSTKLFDTSSGLLKYSFSDDEGGRACFRFADPVITVNSSLMLGTHIYGDLTGNELMLELKSESNQLIYIPLVALDFVGWEYAEASLEALEQDRTYTLNGICIDQKVRRLNNTGSVYLDNLLLYTNTNSHLPSISEPSLEIRQDQSCIRVKAGDMEVNALELHSISGMLLSHVSGQEINIGGLPTGMYILKISVDKSIKINKLILIR